MYFMREETGASLMEYALVGLLLLVVCLLALLALDKHLQKALSGI